MIKAYIPYKDYKNYKMVFGYINGFRAQFLIDIERQESVLNKAYFYTAKNGQEKRVNQISIASLIFFKLKFRNIVFKVEDLTKYEADGRTVYGIIGLDLFNDFIINLDETKNRLVIT